MKTKTDLYVQLLQFGIIRLRNLLGSPSLDPKRLQAAKSLAHLLHYVPSLMAQGASGSGDAYFVVNGCKEFVATYPFREETQFLQLAEIIDELIRVVPGAPGSADVFPSQVVASLAVFRDLNRRA